MIAQKMNLVFQYTISAALFGILLFLVLIAPAMAFPVIFAKLGIFYFGAAALNVFALIGAVVAGAVTWALYRIVAILQSY